MNENQDAVRATLDAAVAEVAAAEAALETVLGELRVAPRSEKVGVTAGVEAAFDRLRSARAELAKLVELVGRT